MNADFTPNLDNYKNPQYFRFWCQKVLPLVYDDSLSYYELLCKVVNYLNDVIADSDTMKGNIGKLLIAYNELQEYVNNYFNSLDVQEEINNKLDQMAASGALSEILDPVIIQAAKEWLDDNITPTTPPVDASLSISGAAADAKVTGDKFNADEIAIKNLSVNNEDYSTDYMRFPFHLGGIDIPSGAFLDNNIRIRCVVPLRKDAVYSVKNCDAYNIRFVVGYKDAAYVDSITDFSLIGEKLVIPFNPAYDRVAITFEKEDPEAAFTSEEAAAAYIAFHHAGMIGTKGTVWNYGGVNSANGNILDNVIRVHTRIKLNEINGLRAMVVSFPENYQLVISGLYLNGVFVRAVRYADMRDGSAPLMRRFSDNVLLIYKDDTFNEVVLALHKLDDSNISDSDFTEFHVQKEKEFKSDLEDVYYAALGDSITYGYIPRNAPGYPGRLKSYATLASEYLGMPISNYGITGSTLAYHASRNPMSRRYMNMRNEADVVTVMGGTNDIRNGISLGTMEDRTDATFYGALHVVLGGLYKKYIIDQGTEKGKKKKIFVLTPIKLLDPAAPDYYQEGTGTLIDLGPWVEAIKEVASYYSFPVLDFYSTSNINPHIDRTILGTEQDYTGYYNPYITDGTHPTQEGAYMMSKVFESFVIDNMG